MHCRMVIDPNRVFQALRPVANIDLAVNQITAVATNLRKYYWHYFSHYIIVFDKMHLQKVAAQWSGPNFDFSA